MSFLKDCGGSVGKQGFSKDQNKKQRHVTNFADRSLIGTLWINNYLIIFVVVISSL